MSDVVQLPYAQVSVCKSVSLTGCIAEAYIGLGSKVEPRRLSAQGVYVIGMFTHPAMLMPLKVTAARLLPKLKAKIAPVTILANMAVKNVP